MANLNLNAKLLGSVTVRLHAFLKYASIRYPIHIACLSTIKIKTQHISSQSLKQFLI